MKKIFLSLLIFHVWASIALGGMVIQKVSSNGGCDANCPAGTYMYCWNGDHSTAEEYCCKTDCAASQDHAGDDGTDRIHNDYGQTGQGLRVTTLNQYIYWAVTGEDLFSDSLITVWVSVRPFSNLSGFITIVESFSDNDNRVGFQVQDDGTLRIDYKGQTSRVTANSANTVTSDNSTWTRIGFSYRVDAGNDMAIKVGANNWEEQDLDFTLWDGAQQPDDVTIGENLFGGGIGTVDIDNLFVVSGWQATDPL